MRNSDVKSSVLEWSKQGKLDGKQITKWEFSDKCTYDIREGDVFTEVPLFTDMTTPFPPSKRR